MTSGSLAGLLDAVFGPGVQTALVRIADASPQTLLGAERLAISGAIAQRQREFAAGRMAARRALKWAGEIPMGPDRAPVWPDGWAGSITHSGDYAVAAVCRGARMLGADLERDEDLPADIVETVLTPRERAEATQDPRPFLRARRIFAIKEALYKAQYPLTRTILEFSAFEVRLNAATFTAALQHTVGPLAKGTGFTGRWGSAEGYCLAGVVL